MRNNVRGLVLLGAAAAAIFCSGCFSRTVPHAAVPDDAGHTETTASAPAAGPEKQFKSIPGRIMGMTASGDIVPIVPSSPADYTIEANDVLEISVWREPDLSKIIPVRPDGKISVPLTGDVEARGKTLTELDDELTKKLAEYLKGPQVSVLIREFGAKKVLVLGEVKNPGIYQFRDNITLLEVLGMAGWVSAQASLSNIAVFGRDAKTVPVSLNDILLLGDMRQNVWIRGGDTVFVASKASGTSRIFVLGEVGSPGVYYFEEGEMTLMKAIAHSGSFTDDASLRGVRIIRHAGQPDERMFKVDMRYALKGDSSRDIPLEPDDAVYVPRGLYANIQYAATTIGSLVGVIRNGFGVVTDYQFYKYAKESRKTDKEAEERAKREFQIFLERDERDKVRYELFLEDREKTQN